MRGSNGSALKPMIQENSLTRAFIDVAGPQRICQIKRITRVPRPRQQAGTGPSPKLASSICAGRSARDEMGQTEKARARPENRGSKKGAVAQGKLIQKNGPARQSAAYHK